jgi:hypothetical protein
MSRKKEELTYYEVRRFHPYRSSMSESKPYSSPSRGEAVAYAREHADYPAEQYLGFIYAVRRVHEVSEEIYNTVEGTHE